MLSLSRRLLPATRSLRAFSASALARNEAPTTGLSEGESLIHEKLTAKFAPTQLQVMDVSGAFSWLLES